MESRKTRKQFLSLSHFKSLGLVVSFFTLILGIDNSLLSHHFKVLTQFSIVSTSISSVLVIFSTVVLGLVCVKRLDWQFLRRLFLLYGGYLVLSYLNSVVLNLNNPKFKFWNFGKNSFFQYQALPYLFTICLLAYLLKKYGHFLSLDKLLAVFSSEEMNGSVYSGFLTLFVLTDRNFRLVLEYGLGDFKQLSYFDPYLPYVLWETLLAFLLVYTITTMLLKTIGEVKTWQFGFSSALSLSLLLAFCFNWWIQYGVRLENDLLGYYTLPGATIFQISCLTLLFLSIYLISNRLIIPSFVIIIIGSCLSVANVMKQRLRQEPVLVTDLTWVKEPKLLFSFLDRETVVTALIVLFVIVCLVYAKLLFLPSDKLSLSLKKRASYVAVILLSTLTIFQVFKHNTKEGKIVSGIPVVSKLNNFKNINWMGFYTNASYRSVAFVWVQQLTAKTMDEPTGYSKAKIEALAKKYLKRAKGINKTRIASLNDQTIIYVLSESLSNPNRVKDTILSQNPLPYIDDIKSKTTSGLMHSDGYGGGTANMEFQTLTGLPFYNYSDTVSVLYSEVFPKMKIRPVISDYFSSPNKYVVHPAGGNNYNRNNIYATLGFDHRYFLTDSNDTLKDMSYQGVSVSDQSVYRKVIQLADNPNAQFFSVITMQNHVPWSEANPEDLTAENKLLSKDENDELTNYSKLIQHTDIATQEFLDDLSQLDKNITVVFYGDHLPGIYPKKVFEENPESQYLTDYFIWNNKKETKLDYPKVNSSDFIATLFEHDNLKVSPYYALLTDVLHHASIDKVKLTKEEQQVADDMKLIQYDISNGKGYLKNIPEFFKILN